MKEPFWKVTARGDASAELSIYGEIDDSGFFGDAVSSKAIRKALSSAGDVKEISVHINSPGGDVFAAQAIYSLLKSHGAKIAVHVDGLAASAASLIAMAGDSIVMPANAMMMIHNPFCSVWGQAEDLRKQAGVLDKIRETMIGAYERSGKTREEIAALLDAETWFTGEEAVREGFADASENAVEIAASARGKTLVFSAAGQSFTVDTARYRHVPGIFVPAACAAEKGSPIMNIEELKQQYPELLAQVRQEAARSERERIQAIFDLGGESGQDGYRAMFEEPVEVETFAVAMLKRMKASRQTPAGNSGALNAIRSDAAAIPPVGGAEGARAALEDSSAVDSLNAAFKGGR